MNKKVITSLTLLFTLPVVFSLNSFAIPRGARSASVKAVATVSETSTSNLLLPLDPQDQTTGTLTGTGEFFVNGNSVQSGATVTSGSTIRTGLDGEVVLDMGTLGRIKVRPDTEIKVTFSSGKVDVLIEKLGSFTANVPSGVNIQGQTKDLMLSQVATTTGEVTVRGRLHTGDDANVKADAKVETIVIKADENRVFDSIESLTATNSVFTVNGCDCATKPAPIILFPYTLLALAGVTAGIIAGVTTSSPKPRATPVQS